MMSVGGASGRRCYEVVGESSPQKISAQRATVVNGPPSGGSGSRPKADRTLEVLVQRGPQGQLWGDAIGEKEEPTALAREGVNSFREEKRPFAQDRNATAVGDWKTKEPCLQCFQSSDFSRRPGTQAKCEASGHVPVRCFRAAPGRHLTWEAGVTVRRVEGEGNAEKRHRSTLWQLGTETKTSGNIEASKRRPLLFENYHPPLHPGGLPFNSKSPPCTCLPPHRPPTRLGDTGMQSVAAGDDDG
ncbi:uncharacterized protein LOC122205897 [Panthera leo]|uniref:uncharacterized protein LOC122205897 n=1 Tax=Panthera leo TaxID=9689 RepID=UPI001C69947D|nr:uncharacterized protein LOC122205897 [Panthera leo]